jgi:hypothetical protein
MVLRMVPMTKTMTRTITMTDFHSGLRFSGKGRLGFGWKLGKFSGDILFKK